MLNNAITNISISFFYACYSNSPCKESNYWKEFELLKYKQKYLFYYNYILRNFTERKSLSR